MPKYEVTLRVIAYEPIKVEADSREEAIKIASELIDPFEIDEYEVDGVESVQRLFYEEDEDDE